MSHVPFAAVVLAGALASGCGNTTAKVLELIDAATPPGSNLRMDVFVVRSATTCAIGPACASTNANQCFTLSNAAGPRIFFNPNQVRFVASTDPEVATAAQSMCFKLGLDTTQVASINTQTAALRTQVYQLTGRDIDLDIRTHEVPLADTAFDTYQGGVFLPPPSIPSAVLANISRDTDFIDVVTGYNDADTGLFPTMNQCAGTGIVRTGGGPDDIGSPSPYSWIGNSPRCIAETAFLSTLMIQLSFALRDVVQFQDLYNSAYPRCGGGDPDPTRWFPRTNDCTADPDAPTCGLNACPDQDTFYGHVLSVHWPRGKAFTGNHCRDGRMDYDETGIDLGGICDLILR